MVHKDFWRSPATLGICVFNGLFCRPGECSCVWTLALAITLLFTGCATTESVPTALAASATVKGYSIRTGLADWESYSLVKVDDLSVKHSYWTSPADTDVVVSPGPHQFKIHAYFNRSLFDGGPFDTYLLLAANIDAGKRYELHGEVVGDTVYVWLQDEAMIHTSEKVSAKYRRAPRNPIPEELLPPNPTSPKEEQSQ